MSTIDVNGAATAVHTKGALETVLPCCTRLLDQQGTANPLDDPARAELQQAMDRYAAGGLRVLAIAQRTLDAGRTAPDEREGTESGLTLIGLVAMADPPRAGVAEAVVQAHGAGMRIHVITGDYGPAAAAIARQVGIGGRDGRIVAGPTAVCAARNWPSWPACRWTMWSAWNKAAHALRRPRWSPLWPER